MSSDPESDDGISELDEDFSVKNGIITMKCNGPTSFSVGRNTKSFTDSIGGCDMDFKETAKRGYAYKENDVRDLEFKCLMKVNSIGDHGFSLSCCTGHHSSSGCCQGFAYMSTVETSTNPAEFRFRKEMWHVSYHDSPKGTYTHKDIDFKLDGHGWFGYGICRYNKQNPGEDDTVVLEAWMNPTPEEDPKNWIMVGKIEDTGGWGNDGNHCGGAKDQIGTWSNAHNRLKSNATSGTINFKNITFREIDPTKDFDEEPPGGGGGSGGGGTVAPTIVNYAMIRGQNPQDYKGIMRTLTEELVEHQTCPDPLNKFDHFAWGDSSGQQIGDICDNHTPVTSQYPSGLWVQPYWSNSDNNCVAPGIDEIDNGSSTKVKNLNNEHVMKNPLIYLIYWGQDWKDRVIDPTAAGLTDLVQNKLLVTDAQYFSKLSQYGSVGVPQWGGTVFNTLTTVPSHANITADEAKNCLKETFNKGLLPIPTSNADKIYFVIIPVGKGILSDTGEPNIAGFHGMEEFALVDPGGAGPGTPTTPPSITTFTASLKLQWHINYDDGVGCGVGGLQTVYSNSTPDQPAAMSDTAKWDNQIRVAEKVISSSSPLRNIVIKQVAVPMKRVGSPGSTPLITLKIWTGTTVKYTSGTTIDPSTLDTDYPDDLGSYSTFDCSDNTYIMQTGDRVGVEYLGTSEDNYVKCSWRATTSGGPNYESEYELGSWHDKSGRDMIMIVWK